MSAGFNHHYVDRCIASLGNLIHLSDATILVLFTLQDQHRHPDVIKAVRNVPVAEIRMQPTVIPTTETIVWIAVVFPKPHTQITAVISRPCLGDRRQALRFGEEMRRHQNHAPKPPVLNTTGMDSSDCRAIAVTNKNNRWRRQRIEHRCQGFGSLTGHVIKRPWQRLRIGLAISRSRESEDTAAGRPCQLFRKITPERDASEPFMEQNDRRCGTRRSGLAGPRGGPPHAIFDLPSRQLQKPGGVVLPSKACHHASSRSLNR